MSIKLETFSKSFSTSFILEFKFDSGSSSMSRIIDYMVDLSLEKTINVSSFDVYINGDHYGSDLDLIQINNGDTLQINVVKDDNTQEAIIKFLNKVF